MIYVGDALFTGRNDYQAEYAGVVSIPVRGPNETKRVMVLSKEHPPVIRYRSVEPVLTPKLRQERHRTIASVVFPTGIDRRNDLGTPDRFDVYYGLADNRIGVARLDVPVRLPVGADVDLLAAKL